MPRIVTFGEIMLRLSPPGHLRFGQATNFGVVYGGGEANVAVSLATLGLGSRYVTRLPANALGDAARDGLRARGVDTSQVVRGGERLGVYFLETGAAARGSRVIYDRAHSAMATIEPGMIDWPGALAGADWFHWSGITPALSRGAAEACAEAVEAARAAGLTVSVDLNYRSKLWDYGAAPAEVMPALVEHCDVVFAGEYDARVCLGVEVGEAAGALPLMRAVHERFARVAVVATPLREGHSASHHTYAAALYDGERLLTSRTYPLNPIVDRVGGGDAFAAGLIYGLLSYPGDRQRALDFAVAASCLKHTIPGDANLATVAEVEALLAGDGGGRVSR